MGGAAQRGGNMWRAAAARDMHANCSCCSALTWHLQSTQRRALRLDSPPASPSLLSLGLFRSRNTPELSSPAVVSP